MSKVSIKYCKVMGVSKETEKGKFVSLGEGCKQKDGTYQNIYWNAYFQDKSVIEGNKLQDVEGTLFPSNYKGKDGKTKYSTVLMVKSFTNQDGGFSEQDAANLPFN